MPEGNRTHNGEPWERCRESQNYGASLHRDNDVDLPFQFVSVVDMAPLAFRTAAFKQIGMFDEGFADPGECAILADWEISMRTWLGGWQARGAARGLAVAAAVDDIRMRGRWAWSRARSLSLAGCV